jgi:hypothetical protein
MENLMINNTVAVTMVNATKEQVKIAGSTTTAEDKVVIDEKASSEAAVGTVSTTEVTEVNSSETVVGDTANAEVVTDETPGETVEGEVATGDVVIDESAVKDGASMDGGFADPVMGEDIYTDPMMETGMLEVKDPLLSSWPFVIGISAAVLFVSVFLGALLAKRKIKKGIELYED